MASHQPPDLAGAQALATALAAGELTSRALVDDVLDRIAAAQPVLNAFRIVLERQARFEAAVADERLERGERRPLLGVPVAIKDDTDLEGQTTPFGCPGPFAPVAADGGVVRRLREAGAVIVGKTNTPEIGLWPISDSPAFGHVRSPWSLEHTPGGSSGGTSAAVAAGIVPIGVGSDGAGSIRIPAAWSGLVGIKPQRGRVSCAPLRFAVNGLAVNGPLARTVADAALLLDVLSGQIEPRERFRAPAPEIPFAESARRDPGRLRIAVCLNPPFIAMPHALDPGVRAAVLRLADVLAGLGHEVRERRIVYGQIGATFMARSMAAMRDWVEDYAPEPALLDRRTRHAARVGATLAPTLPGTRALEALQRRTVGRIFADADVVLMPTTAEPPLRVGAIDGLGINETNAVVARACPYTFAWNVLGWPGINVPAGLVAGRLSVGAQLLGPACSEPLLISLAAQLEDRERWHERRPDPLPVAAAA